MTIPFLSLLNLSLPPVGAGNRTQHLATGCQPLFDQRSGQTLRRPFIWKGGGDLNAFRHRKLSHEARTVHTAQRPVAGLVSAGTPGVSAPRLPSSIGVTIVSHPLLKRIV